MRFESEDGVHTGPAVDSISCATSDPGELRHAMDGNLPRRDLLHDRSFWGLVTTQFLGAFNDNLYKQLMLLLALPTIAVAGVASVDETAKSDLQGWATLVFALPFVLLSGLAGYLSDRFSKTPIIVICKYAEIAIVILGMLAFWYYDVLGQAGTWVVLFLMGVHSSFFGPGKYGLLPELFRDRDLPRANALMMMTTWVAIILGVAVAGPLVQFMGTDSAQQIWPAMSVCVLLAIVGTITAHLIRKTPPASPQLRFTPASLAISRDMLGLFRRDRPLLMAVIVSSIFWMVAGLCGPTVNRLGVEQLSVGEFKASILTACIGIGIMLGSPVASYICRTTWSGWAVNIGLAGVFVALMALGLWNDDEQVLGYWGSFAFLIGLGVFAAIFSIPIMVFMQARPPEALKGRLIATMNQANFLGILLAGPIYQLFEFTAGWMGWPISSVFWMIGGLVLPLLKPGQVSFASDSSSNPKEVISEQDSP